MPDPAAGRDGARERESGFFPPLRSCGQQLALEKGKHRGIAGAARRVRATNEKRERERRVAEARHSFFLPLSLCVAYGYVLRSSCSTASPRVVTPSSRSTWAIGQAAAERIRQREQRGEGHGEIRSWAS